MNLRAELAIFESGEPAAGKRHLPKWRYLEYLFKNGGAG